MSTGPAQNPKRREFYDRIGKHDKAPLWEVLGALVPKTPVTPCLPALWKYREVRPYLMESGELISAEEAERQLREAYDEGAGRLGLLTRLVMAMGQKATRALAIDHAGLAIFSTALAMASGQERSLTVLSFADRQFARLALALRAAGLKQQAVEEQFLYLHPEISLPDGFDRLRADRAAALLAGSRPEAAVL